MTGQRAVSPRWTISALHQRRISSEGFQYPAQSQGESALLGGDGSGLVNSGAVLVCGDAMVEDRVIADMASSPELAALAQTVIERQPSSKFMSSFLGRRLFPSYYWRIMIYVTPVHAFYWRTRDFTATPESLGLKELRHVAAGK